MTEFAPAGSPLSGAVTGTIIIVKYINTMASQAYTRAVARPFSTFAQLESCAIGTSHVFPHYTVGSIFCTTYEASLLPYCRSQAAFIPIWAELITDSSLFLAAWCAMLFLAASTPSGLATRYSSVDVNVWSSCLRIGTYCSA